MLTNSSILAQPENKAADRQIYMIIVITKSCKDRKGDWKQHVRSALYISTLARTQKGVTVVKWRRSVM